MELGKLNNEINGKYFSNTKSIFIRNDLDTLYLIHFLIYEKFTNTKLELKNRLLKTIKKAQLELEAYDVNRKEK